VTVAAGSLTGLPNNHRDFDLPIANFLHVGCHHYYRFARIGESEEDFASRLASELDQLIVNEGADTVAAFFAEPVMGAGGVLVPPKGYFDKIQKVLRKHDVLLVADEVICGFGRVGTMFAIETYGMQPDIITLGKQMSSGYLPISATIISNPIFEALVAESDKIGLFAHGFTHSGHPVAAAVAVETLKIYEERHILDHVRAIAPHFQDRLRGLYSHPLIGEARGVGLLGALELVRDKPNKEPFDPALKVGDLAFELAQEEGLIVRAIGDSLAVCPPLIINDAEIDELFNRLSRALDRTHVELRRRATDAEPTAVPRIARA
jgi:4-aminobutyrate--pyruvate transaminase